jgi:hypothetical protein
MTILETKFPELSDKDGKAYAIAVAKVGGYLDRSSDPPPGWQTMWKGFKKVRTWATSRRLLFLAIRKTEFRGNPP